MGHQGVGEAKEDGGVVGGPAAHLLLVIRVVDADAEDLSGVWNDGQELRHLQGHPVLARADEGGESVEPASADQGLEVRKPGSELRPEVHQPVVVEPAVGRFPILDEGR